MNKKGIININYILGFLLIGITIYSTNILINTGYKKNIFLYKILDEGTKQHSIIQKSKENILNDKLKFKYNEYKIDIEEISRYTKDKEDNEEYFNIKSIKNKEEESKFIVYIYNDENIFKTIIHNTPIYNIKVYKGNELKYTYILNNKLEPILKFKGGAKYE